VREGIDADIGLAEVRIVLGVVRDVAPHSPGFEVIVRPQEQGFAPDAFLITLGDLVRISLDC